jgi:hypothetical protein
MINHRLGMEDDMRIILATILAGCCIFTIGVAQSREARQERRYELAQARPCPQVIHCGIKNGKMKEYPTVCAAQDDGATNIAPRQGSSCPEIK